METQYKTKKDVIDAAQKILNKSLRDIVSDSKISEIEEKVKSYASRRKGFLGELIEKFVFKLDVNNRAEADFKTAGVELKTNPLRKHNKKIFISKERLVFSMIDYDNVVAEKWETSSFLKKNKVLLLMFYLWIKNQSILDYEFKFIHLLDLLNDISKEDIFQIQKDWEFIVDKIKRGEAHLLSEGDTYYLGACTKAANSSIVRDQPLSRIPAKPRAFSFKQQYLNFLIQKQLLGVNTSTESIFTKERRIETVEDAILSKFTQYIGKNDIEIKKYVGWGIEGLPKNWKQILVNRIMGVKSKKIEELEKANITLKVVTLEHTGTLKESLSFPAFNYKDLVNQTWFDAESEIMSDFHVELEMKKFLFVVFQKTKKNNLIILKKVKFWNFPMKDIEKAKNVWDETIKLINDGKIVKKISVKKNGKEKRFTYFPGTTFNGVAHVRPHGQNSNDISELKIPDKLTGLKEYTKHCFWLNAKYIQKELEN